MPIATINTTTSTSPGSPPNIQGEPQQPFLTNEEQKTSLLFNKEQDISTIAQYIKGMKWSVDYYYQIKNINDPSSILDINTPATIQKYVRINSLILILQTAVNQDTFDNITGEADINCGFLPYVNDVFRATMLGGREAIFTITSVDIKNYNLSPIYNIQFKILFLLDLDNTERYNDLQYKVMKNYVYDKDHLLDYGATIILASDYTKKLNYKKVIPELVEYYLDTFVNRDRKLIALPTNSSVYIDSMLTDFFFMLVTTNDSYKVNDVNRVDLALPNVGYTIWDVIIKRDINLLSKCTKDVAFVYTPVTIANALTRNVAYVGVNFFANKFSDSDPVSIPDIRDISFTTSNPVMPPIGVLTQRYVFTDGLYNSSSTDCGLLEQLVLDYLKGNFLNTDSLDILVSEYQYWSTVEQFYFIPILITLLRDSINGAFSSL